MGIRAGGIVHMAFSKLISGQWARRSSLERMNMRRISFAARWVRIFPLYPSSRTSNSDIRLKGQRFELAIVHSANMQICPIAKKQGRINVNGIYIMSETGEQTPRGRKVAYARGCRRRMTTGGEPRLSKWGMMLMNRWTN